MRCAMILLVTVLAGSILLLGTGCSGKSDEEKEEQARTQKEKGLFERAGAATDSAVKKGTDAAGKAYDKTKETAKETYDKTKDATGKVVDKTREKTGDALQKAGEWVKPDKETEEK